MSSSPMDRLLYAVMSGETTCTIHLVHVQTSSSSTICSYSVRFIAITLIRFVYDLESSSQADELGLQKCFIDFLHKANRLILFSGILLKLGKFILSMDQKYHQELNVAKCYFVNIITEDKKHQQNCIDHLIEMTKQLVQCVSCSSL